MPSFIYLYRGPAPTPASPEQAAERAAAFGAWMEQVGAALVDVGRPFGASASVCDDGTEGLRRLLRSCRPLPANLRPHQSVASAQ